jgi:hypothetical protein
MPGRSARRAAPLTPKTRSQRTENLCKRRLHHGLGITNQRCWTNRYRGVAAFEVHPAKRRLRADHRLPRACGTGLRGLTSGQPDNPGVAP